MLSEKKEKHKIPSPFRLWIWQKEKTDAKTKILKTNQESKQWFAQEFQWAPSPSGECLGTQEEGGHKPKVMGPQRNQN